MRAYFLTAMLLAGCDARDFWRDRAPASQEEVTAQGCKKSTDCPTEKPLCQVSQGVCVACGELPAVTRDTECVSRGTNVCITSSGRCGDCNSTADCKSRGETFTCQSNVCSDSCKQHEDCGSLTCDTFLGKCLPTSGVIYVDNKGGVGCTSGDGSGPDKALCTLDEVKAKLTASRRAVRVIARTAPYGPLTLDAIPSVTFYGPTVPTSSAGQTAKISSSRPDTDSLVLSNGTDATFDGFEIGDGKRGVVCSGTSRLTLRRSLVQNSASEGIFVDGCTVRIERNVITKNRSGLSLNNANNYRIVNNFIIGNSLNSSVVVRASNGLFSFNSVVNNTSGTAGGMDCGTSPLTIKSSIFVGNDMSAGVMGSQFTGNCILENTVVGPQDKIPDAGSKNIGRKAPEFVMSGPADLRLTNGAANQDCCLNKISAADRGDVDADILGIPRGNPADIGAHELSQ